MIYRWLLGVVLLFAILLVLLPNKGEDSDARIASASMLACTLDFRERVGRQLAGKVAVTARFENKCRNVIAAVEVAEGRSELSAQDNDYNDLKRTEEDSRY